MRRHNRFEAGLACALLRLGVPLIPVDEHRLASADGRNFKNPDLIVFRPGLSHGLIEVKGRSLRDPWFTKRDLTNLRAWQSWFGGAFEAHLVFVYPSSLESSHFMDQGSPYQAWMVGISDSERLARSRSQRWATLSLTRRAFQLVARPFLAWAAPTSAQADAESAIGDELDYLAGSFGTSHEPAFHAASGSSGAES